MIKVVPFKTPREIELNKQYMSWFNAYGIIPKVVVNRFKKEVENIVKANKIYSNESTIKKNT